MSSSSFFSPLSLELGSDLDLKTMNIYPGASPVISGLGSPASLGSSIEFLGSPLSPDSPAGFFGSPSLVEERPSEKMKYLLELNANYFTVQRLFREIFETLKQIETVEVESIRENLNRVVSLCALYQQKSIRDDLLSLGGGELLFKLHNLNNDAKSLLLVEGVLDCLDRIFKRTKPSEGADVMTEASLRKEVDQLCRAIRIKVDLSHENIELLDLIQHEVEKVRLSVKQVFVLNMTESVRLKIDAQKREIFLESLRVLLDNAAKYGEKSEPIIIDADYSEGWLKLKVSNSGYIPDPEQVFKPKFLAEPLEKLEGSEALKETGWGFGLIRAKELLENHGSSLSLLVVEASRKITFEIGLNLLELVKEEEILSDRGSCVNSGYSGAASSVSVASVDFSETYAPVVKALLVDDGAVDLRIYKRAASRLDKSKIEFFYASNAESALEIFHQNKDLAWICSDQEMPGMSGADLIQGLRSSGFSGQAYLCSGNVFEGFLPEGVDHAFLKPSDGVNQFVEFYNNYVDERKSKNLQGARKFKRVGVEA